MSEILEKNVKEKFFQKRILITGAGGSIGSSLSRAVAALKPSKIILIENSEYFLWKIKVELSESFPDCNISYCLADITAKARIEKIFSQEKPHIVFHTAAVKHVSFVEENPCEGFLTNLIGTKILSEAASRHQAESFIFLSTDKAVEPKSKMGASKRIAELWLESQQERSGETHFIALRFGNVFGSAGSVAPLFARQIEKGGPLTVTDQNAERYFLPKEKAVSALLTAGFLGSSSKRKYILFVLEMGRPVRILDLARSMIAQAPQKDKIEIKITGLTSGEKIKENLIAQNEKAVPVTGTDLYYLLSEEEKEGGHFGEDNLRLLEEACRKADISALSKIVSDILPDFSWSETR